MQYFTGETVFQKRPPINPADFSKFRKRAGIQSAALDEQTAAHFFRLLPAGPGQTA